MLNQIKSNQIKSNVFFLEQYTHSQRSKALQEINKHLSIYTYISIAQGFRKVYVHVQGWMGGILGTIKAHPPQELGKCHNGTWLFS